MAIPTSECSRCQLLVAGSNQLFTAMLMTCLLRAVRHSWVSFVAFKCARAISVGQLGAGPHHIGPYTQKTMLQSSKGTSEVSAFRRTGFDDDSTGGMRWGQP